MGNRNIRRPSPALIVAFVALIVALGGTSYAAFTLPANSVGTKQLKNKAVTTKKIKNGTVTAAKINTSGLTVPNALHASRADNATHATSADSATNATNATHATSADSATNATNVDGMQMTSFEYSGVNGDTKVVVLDNFDGLTLKASCTSGSLATNGLTVYANSAVAPGSLDWSGIAKNGTHTGGSAGNDSYTAPAANTDLLLMHPNAADVDTGNGSGGGFGFATGQIHYTQFGASRVTVNWTYDGNFGGSFPACYFAGTAIGAPTGPGFTAPIKRGTGASSSLTAAGHR